MILNHLWIKHMPMSCSSRYRYFHNRAVDKTKWIQKQKQKQKWKYYLTIEKHIVIFVANAPLLNFIPGTLLQIYSDHFEKFKALHFSVFKMSKIFIKGKYFL